MAAQGYEKIFAIHVFNKGFISRIYKELQINKKKTNIQQNSGQNTY